MPHAILVNPENPLRTIATQPFGWPLDCARGNQVVRFPVVINIFVEGGDRHAFVNHNIATIFSDTGFFV